MRHVVKVHVVKMTESCDRTTFIVRLTSDEGFTIDPEAFASHSLYDTMNGVTGLSIEEARDRALTSAAHWADFYDMPVTRFRENGILYQPQMVFETYMDQRLEAADDAAKKALLD